jgi:hypothetical protein
VPQLPHQPGTVQFLSQHPPLYHLVIGLVLRLGMAVHHPVAGYFAARLVTALCMVGMTILVALLVMSFPGRHRAATAVGAAAVAAAFGPLQQASATVMSDAPAALLGAAVLLMLVRIVRFGATRARVVGLTLCCAAAMLVRISLIAVVAIAVLALLIAAVLPPPGSAPDGAGSLARRLGRGVGQAALVLAGVLLASGWFYRLNVQRYGSVTGDGYLTGDHSSASALSFLFDPHALWRLWQQLFGGVVRQNAPNPRYVLVLATVGAGLVAAGVIALVVRALARRGHPVWSSMSRSDVLRTVLAGGAVAGALLAPLVEMSDHVGLGGAPHGRYLSPGVAAFGAIVGAVLLAVPLLRRTWAVLVFVAAEAFGIVAARVGVIGGGTRHLTEWFSVFSGGLSRNGVPAASAVLVLLVLAGVAGMLAVAVALWRLNARPALAEAP